MSSQQIRWPMFQHVERRANRLNDMIAHLDVDPVKLARHRAGDSFAEARASCLNCSNAHACLFWLEGADANSATPEFCPNIELFLNCRRGAI